MIIRARRLKFFMRTCDSLSKNRHSLARKGRYIEGTPPPNFQYYMPLFWSKCFNLPSESIDQSCKIMQATARQSVRTERPVYSLSLYFRRHERIEYRTSVKIACGLIAELGLSKHQAILIGGTANNMSVVHVVANRVEPNTCKAAVLSYDHLIISAYAEATEKAFRLSHEDHRLFNNALRKRGLFIKARRPIQEYTRIAWTSEMMLKELEYAVDEIRWTNLRRRLWDCGLKIEPEDDTFVVTNPVNGQRYTLEKTSDLQRRVNELFQEWADWLSELLPITAERRNWDGFLRQRVGRISEA